MDYEPFTVAVAQIAPVLLDREATLKKVIAQVEAAGKAGAKLVAFGEAAVPAYPIWLGETGGARFNDDYQKTIHAIYVDQAVEIPEAADHPRAKDHLKDVKVAAEAHGVAVVLGVIERGIGRGHSLFCSRVIIGPDGNVWSVHRKLVPTYEERLAWTPGDGHGLVTHPLGPFTLGALNCWENWMPLARAALYQQGLDLHCMLWPGSRRNTEDLTRVVAKESRSFVLSASCLIRASDVAKHVPGAADWTDPDFAHTDGGSCISGPNGQWLVEPTCGEECLLTADLDFEQVLRERQNFDPFGHYSRPELLELKVDRRRL